MPEARGKRQELKIEGDKKMVIGKKLMVTGKEFKKLRISCSGGSAPLVIYLQAMLVQGMLDYFDNQSLF
jgi:hypothetical protein